MAKCELCGGKVGLIMKWKVKDGTICVDCQKKIDAILKNYTSEGFQYMDLYTISQCKEILSGSEGASRVWNEIDARINQLKDIGEKNRYCLLCGKEQYVKGYFTSDLRNICVRCGSATNTLVPGDRFNRNHKMYIKGHDSNYFLKNMADFEWANEFLAVNYTTQTMYEASKGTFRFDQIIKIENDQETYEVRKGKKGHPIMRAVVGNALMGSTGAVIGTLTNDDQRHYTTEKGRRILTIYFKDDNGEIIKDEFKCNTDEEYIKLETVVMKIFKQGEEEESNNVVENIQQPVVQTSVADEIKKYKELLDIGAITQEEFDGKKKQLLGL